MRWLIFIISLFILPVYAQINLVFNGDFELFDDCPTTESYPQQYPDYEITNCLGWRPPTYGTSDFFHTCANNTLVAIPFNAVGYQFPYNGNGYIGGFFTNYTGGGGWDGYNGIMWWEYVQGQLIQPLEAGHIYKVNMAVALAEYSDLAINEIGIYFSTDSFSTSNTASLNLTPQVTFFNPNYFTDTLNWILVEGIFTAGGGEKFLTIGNFKSNIDTDTIRVYDGNTLIPPLENPYKTYMYMDDVQVTDVTEEFQLANVFSPNGDGINDEWILPNISGYEIIIYNRWGNIVIKQLLNGFIWDGTTPHGTQCSEGVYYYIIQHALTGKVFKHSFLHLFY